MSNNSSSNNQNLPPPLGGQAFLAAPSSEVLQAGRQNRPGTFNSQHSGSFRSQSSGEYNNSSTTPQSRNLLSSSSSRAGTGRGGQGRGRSVHHTLGHHGGSFKLGGGGASGGISGSDTESIHSYGTNNTFGTHHTLMRKQSSMVHSTAHASSNNNTGKGGNHFEGHVPSHDSDKDESSSDGDESNHSLAISETQDEGEEEATVCSAIGKRFRALIKRPGKARALDSDAFYLVSGNSTLRILTYNIVHTKIFEALVIMVILFNSVMLALDDPTTDEVPDYVQKLEYFFIAAFSVEAALKIFAFGFFAHKGAYLRNPWNVIDFVIVLLSYLSLVPGFDNYTAFRTIRVLRPLRSMNAIPPLKTIVQGLLYSIKGLFNVMLLMLFIFLVFGILAVQLWMGELQRRCYNNEDGSVIPLSYCSEHNPEVSMSGLRGRSCPEGYTCKGNVNPNYGFTSFDNVLWAFLVIIQVITLEGWGLIMFATMDAWGWPAFIYFILLILIGSYFVLNLALAVINAEFSEAKVRINKEQKEQLEEDLRHRQQRDFVTNANRRNSLHPQLALGGDPNALGVTSAEDQWDDENDFGNTRQQEVDGEEPRDDCSSVYSSDDEEELKKKLAARPMTSGAVQIGGKRLRNPTAWRRFVRTGPIRKTRNFLFKVVEGSPRLYQDEQQETTWFTRFIILCIFFNTIVLAAEHHGQSYTQDQIASVSNFVFTIIFGVEFLLKITALNPLRFVSDGFNVLDGVIVIISFVELGLGEGGTFTVLRAFRLLRVFKLLKNFPSLRAIVDVMLHAIRDTGYLNIIILLYLFIASLIGMQLFGGEMKKIEEMDPDWPEDERQRSTFDSFYWAFYTVFQILTRDSWPDLMWTAMKTTNPGASIYFLFCVVTGDFIILNLFLAILISSFDKAGDASVELDDKDEGIILTDGRDGSDGAGSKRGGAMLSKKTGSIFDKAMAHGDKTTAKIFTNAKNNNNSTTSGTSALNKSERQKSSDIISGSDIEMKEMPNSSSQLGPGSPGMGDKAVFSPRDHHKSTNAPQGPLFAENSGSIKESPVGPNNNHFLSPVDSGFVLSHDSAGVGTGNNDSQIEGGDPVVSANDEICPVCETRYQKPYPTLSKAIAKKTPEELHERMCEHVQRRRTKEDAIERLIQEYCGTDDDDLLAEMHSQQQPPQADMDLQDVDLGDSPKSSFHVFGKMGGGRGNYPNPLLPGRDLPKPTPQRVEEAFGTAWEVGLLLSEDVEQYLNMKTWSPFRKLLFQEQRVLDLKVGEEQVGRALVAYTSANIPTEMITNGGVSCFLFGPQNPFRGALTQLVANPWFDRIILVCIFFSSLIMAMDNPRDEGTPFNDVLVNLNLVFVSIFILEAGAKIIAMGFIFHPTAYLREGWNILDFSIVVISIISVVLRLAGQSGFEFIQVLRVVRALRPLRVINRNRGLKMVVQTLLLSIKGIANVSLISMLIYIVFAILGVQLFSGSQYSCTDGIMPNRSSCVGIYQASTEEPVLTLNSNGTVVHSGYQTVYYNATREWTTEDFNFDNAYNSFLTLFVVATLDDWSDVMYSVIDSVGKDQAPQLDAHPEYGIFFVIFIIIGNFFLLNMFVGVIIFNFNQVKSQMDGLNMLNEQQKLWVETQRMMLNYKPTVKLKPGKHPIRMWCWRVVEDPMFEIATAIMIALNVVFIAMNHYQQQPVFDDLDLWSNYFFVTVFALEALLKITAFADRYFYDNWNRFDFFLVVISFVEIGIEQEAQAGNLPSVANAGILRVFRIFRITRMTSLVKKAKDVRILLETLWFSLPSLANIGAFLLLLFFVFSVLGVQLFALIRRREGLDHHLNFESFPNAFLLLVQVATLDNWGGVLVAVSDNTNCPPNEKGQNTCGTPFAPVYFFAFIVLAGFVMVNLFVAIILDNFATTMQLDKSKLKVADLKKFADAWSTFDEEASWLMSTSRFPDVLALLKPPLGISRRADRVGLLNLTRQYAIPEHGGTIHFVETLIPLARKVQDVKFSDADIREHEDNWKIQFPELTTLTLLRYRQKRCTVDQYLAAAYIQAAFRRRCAVRLTEQMWNDKYGTISEAYDKLRVPEDDRLALHAMERSREERWQQYLAKMELAAAYVQRDRARSLGVDPNSTEGQQAMQAAAQAAAGAASGGGGGKTGGGPYPTIMNPLASGSPNQSAWGMSSASPTKSGRKRGASFMLPEAEEVTSNSGDGPNPNNIRGRGRGPLSMSGSANHPDRQSPTNGGVFNDGTRLMSMSAESQGGSNHLTPTTTRSPAANGSGDAHFGLLGRKASKAPVEEEAIDLDGTTSNITLNPAAGASSPKTTPDSKPLAEASSGPATTGPGRAGSPRGPGAKPRPKFTRVTPAGGN